MGEHRQRRLPSAALLWVGALATILSTGCTTASSPTAERATPGSAAGESSAVEERDPAGELATHLDEMCSLITEYAHRSARRLNSDAGTLPHAAAQAAAAADHAAAAAELHPGWMVVAEAAGKLAEWEADDAAGSPYGRHGFQTRQAALGDIEIACGQRARTGTDDLTILADGRPDPAIVDSSEEGASDAILACSSWLEASQLGAGGDYEHHMERAMEAAVEAADASDRWAMLAAALTARFETLRADPQSPSFNADVDAGIMAIHAVPQACQQVILLPAQFTAPGDAPLITMEQLLTLLDRPSASRPTRPAEPTYEQGLSCQDVAERGGSYADAVAYWNAEGRPARMNASGSGTPCQSVYPKEQVYGYWQRVCGFDQSSAKQLVTAEFQQRLGRNPTDSELEKFVNVLRAETCGLPQAEE